MEQQAFERQVATELRDMAGDPVTYDALAVARAAKSAKRSWSPWQLGRALGSSTARLAQVGIAAAVIVLFGGFLLLGLTPDESDELVGPLPSASVGPDATDVAVAATFPPPMVTYATGTLEEIPTAPEDDATKDDGMGFGLEGFDAGGTGPWRYRVISTDPRLTGIAHAVETGGRWVHELTLDDVDDPGGPWEVSVATTRFEIRNDEGAWSGMVGPAVWASSEASFDDLTDEGRDFGSVGPTILTGSGAYAGLSALMQFTDVEEPESPGDWVPAQSPNGATFEAVILNRELPGPPSESLFDERMEWRDQTGR